MPDEEKVDVEVLDALAEPDSDAASEAKDDELPTDPEELKKIVLAERQEKIDAKREAAAEKRKAERQKARADENEVAKKQWYGAWEKSEAKNTQGDAKSENSNSAKSSTNNQIKAALKGKELADYVADDEKGFERLVNDLQEGGVFVTPQRLETILNERDEHNRRATNLFGTLTARFPDLNDADSELAIETTERAKRLIEEDGMDAPAAYRIAASEAALDLGIKPKERAKREPAPATNGNRLRTAQGGPVGKGGGQPEKITIPESVIAEGMKMGLSRERVIKRQTQLIKDRRQHESSQVRR